MTADRPIEQRTRVDHGPLDHGPLDHGPVDHGPVDHRPVAHQALDRVALDHMALDRVASDQVTLDHVVAYQAVPDRVAADRAAADRAAVDQGAVDQGALVLGPDFARAWAIAEGIAGWLTRDQAAALWRAAQAVRPGGHIVEIGSHRGRSTVVLGLAARQVGARVTAIDPFVTGRLFGGIATRTVFEANLRRTGLTTTVTLVPDYSTRLRRSWKQPIDLLYIDGKHDYWTVVDDLAWSRHLPLGGEFLVHDCFSSLGVTSGVLRQLLLADEYGYVGRTGSLARFVLGVPSRADRMRAVGELGWFLRNLGLKVLLRLRLRPVVRVFGHAGPHDPY